MHRGVAAGGVRRTTPCLSSSGAAEAPPPRRTLSSKEYNGSAGVMPMMDAHAHLIQSRRSILEPGAAARGPSEPTRRRRSSSTGTTTDDASAGKESAGALQEVMAPRRKAEPQKEEAVHRSLILTAIANGEGHCTHQCTTSAPK